MGGRRRGSLRPERDGWALTDPQLHHSEAVRPCLSMRATKKVKRNPDQPPDALQDRKLQTGVSPSQGLNQGRRKPFVQARETSTASAWAIESQASIGSVTESWQNGHAGRKRGGACTDALEWVKNRPPARQGAEDHSLPSNHDAKSTSARIKV